MSIINQRERLIAVLKGQKPDAVPWFGDLSYWYDAQLKQGRLDKKYRGERGYLRLHQDTGIGIYFYAPFVFKSEFCGEVEYSRIEKDDCIIERYITPVGTVTSRQHYLKKAYTYSYVEHFVKDIDDLRVMEYISNNTRYKPDYQEFIRYDQMWGEWGMPVVLTPINSSPIQRLLARWAGVETTINMMMDHMDEFDQIIESIKSSEDDVFDIIAQGPGMIVEFPENLSSEITGKMLFNKYSKDYYTQRIAHLHQAGKYTALHIDGTLKALLPLLSQTGLDIAEAVTPAPVGDVEVEQLRELAGDDLIIWGGIPGALFSNIYSDRFFDEYVRKVLDVFPPGSKFVLGVADQVPPDADFKRMCRVRELIEKTA